jgi:hypothetical protein
MNKEPIPFAATDTDGRRYFVDVVYDTYEGILGRIAWITGLNQVEQRPDGSFVAAGTGVVLKPITVRV